MAGACGIGMRHVHLKPGAQSACCPGAAVMSLAGRPEVLS
jgi:hypothetical protein